MTTPARRVAAAVAPSIDAAVVPEDRAAAELRRLVAPLGEATIEITPIWIAAFSGLVATVSLHFADDVPPMALARVLDAHPDLEAADEADAAAPDNAGPPEADGDDEPEETESAPAEPGVISLRDVLDRDPVRYGTPLFGRRGVRVVLMADPIHRTATATSTLLTRWMTALG